MGNYGLNSVNKNITTAEEYKQLDELIAKTENLYHAAGEAKKQIDRENFLENKKQVDELYKLQVDTLKKLQKQNFVTTEEEYKKRIEAVNKEANLKFGKDNLAKAAWVKEQETKLKKQLDYSKKFIAQNKKLADKAAEDEKKAKKKEEVEQAAKEAKKLKLKGKEYWDYLETATGMSKKEITANAKEDALKTLADNIKEKFSLNNMTKALSGFAKNLETTIDSIAATKGAIDTRLQGSRNQTSNGSYWDQITKDMTAIAGVTPFFKQSDVANKIKEYVGQGISFNVEQRAFLEVMSDKIATTFNAADGTLLKLVRIQQQDTTAARLGMESALTSFLNNMYETTEYMGSIADSIRGKLYEASALMNAEEATAFEYQVQKWMGSMYSVGMSDSSVGNIADAIGKLAAGDISGLTGSGTGNLLVMAANNAGISISEALQEGLDDSKTNRLLTAMVDYLAGIYNSSSNSKVLQQQFASVYGLTASDLKAIANLSSSTATVSNNFLNYGGALSQLETMAGTIGQRTSTGEMLSNAWDNFQYTMASGIANSPALYGIYKTAALLDDLVGGINIPTISVMGSGVDLNASVADLMNVAALSGSALKGIGAMMTSGSGGGLSGKGLLNALNVNSSSYVSRGTGEGLITTQPMASTSESVTIGQGNTSDIQNASINSATDSANQQLVEAQEQTTEVQLKTVDEHVVAIYNLLQNVISGTSTLTVRNISELPWGLTQ